MAGTSGVVLVVLAAAVVDSRVVTSTNDEDEEEEEEREEEGAYGAAGSTVAELELLTTANDVDAKPREIMIFVNFMIILISSECKLLFLLLIY